jgi:predicted GNAT superfamily acetyltransferase
MTPPHGIEIRHVRTHEEFVACVELQAATWGAGFREAVPATILKIAQRLGGVTAGAFAVDGALLGFVFGMTGIERGEVVHWSDMLAVRADLQNHGLGRRLKAFQRDAVRAVGATRMYWTYDPLVARNAHFNLNRLGARVSEYVPDMYGTETGSTLHSGFGTDRFIVVWTLADGEAIPPSLTADDGVGAPILNAGSSHHGAAEHPPPLDGVLPPRVRVEIPLDILGVQAASVDRAAQWRASSRRALQWAFAHGYSVERFVPDGSAPRGFYLLARR